MIIYLSEKRTKDIRVDRPRETGLGRTCLRHRRAKDGQPPLRPDQVSVS
jgi:hypothetical protein